MSLLRSRSYARLDLLLAASAVVALGACQPAEVSDRADDASFTVTPLDVTQVVDKTFTLKLDTAVSFYSEKPSTEKYKTKPSPGDKLEISCEHHSGDSVLKPVEQSHVWVNSPDSSKISNFSGTLPYFSFSTIFSKATSYSQTASLTCARAGKETLVCKSDYRSKTAPSYRKPVAIGEAFVRVECRKPSDGGSAGEGGQGGGSAGEGGQGGEGGAGGLGGASGQAGGGGAAGAAGGGGSSGSGGGSGGTGGFSLVPSDSGDWVQNTAVYNATGSIPTSNLEIWAPIEPDFQFDGFYENSVVLDATTAPEFEAEYGCGATALDGSTTFCAADGTYGPSDEIGVLSLRLTFDIRSTDPNRPQTQYSFVANQQGATDSERYTALSPMYQGDYWQQGSLITEFMAEGPYMIVSHWRAQNGNLVMDESGPSRVVISGDGHAVSFVWRRADFGEFGWRAGMFKHSGAYLAGSYGIYYDPATEAANAQLGTSHPTWQPYGYR